MDNHAGQGTCISAAERPREARIALLSHLAESKFGSRLERSLLDSTHPRLTLPCQGCVPLSAVKTGRPPTRATTSVSIKSQFTLAQLTFENKKIDQESPGDGGLFTWLGSFSGARMARHRAAIASALAAASPVRSLLLVTALLFLFARWKSRNDSTAAPIEELLSTSKAQLAHALHRTMPDSAPPLPGAVQYRQASLADQAFLPPTVKIPQNGQMLPAMVPIRLTIIQ